MIAKIESWKNKNSSINTDGGNKRMRLKSSGILKEYQNQSRGDNFKNYAVEINIVVESKNVNLINAINRK